MAVVNLYAQGQAQGKGQAQGYISKGPYVYDLYLASLSPKAWWKLSDAVGSATAADSSGNGYTGTVNGGVTFGQAGPIQGDRAALFDGTSGYISTAYQPAFSAITIAVWTNAEPALFGGNTHVMAAGGAGASGFAFYVQNGAGIYIEQGGTGYGPTWPQNPGAGWEFWVLTWDGATVKGYYQGAQQGAVAAAPGPIACANPLTIGGYSPGGDFFPGSIAEVAIFPFALSATQVAKAYSLAS